MGSLGTTWWNLGQTENSRRCLIKQNNLEVGTWQFVGWWGTKGSARRKPRQTEIVSTVFFLLLASERKVFWVWNWKAIIVHCSRHWVRLTVLSFWLEPPWIFRCRGFEWGYCQVRGRQLPHCHAPGCTTPSSWCLLLLPLLTTAQVRHSAQLSFTLTLLLKRIKICIFLWDGSVGLPTPNCPEAWISLLLDLFNEY